MKLNKSSNSSELSVFNPKILFLFVITLVALFFMEKWSDTRTVAWTPVTATISELTYLWRKTNLEFSYTYDGVEYQQKISTRAGGSLTYDEYTRKYPVGSTKEILINPKRPNQYRFTDESIDTGLDGAKLGLIALAAVVIFGILSFEKKKK